MQQFRIAWIATALHNPRKQWKTYDFLDYGFVFKNVVDYLLISTVAV